MFLNSKTIFAFKGPIKYFESTPPELGRLVEGKQTIFFKSSLILFLAILWLSCDFI